MVAGASTSGVRAPRLRASIHAKLIGLTASIVAAIVIFLTAYFASQAIGQLHDEQLGKVSTYGELLANQVRSAVAFADHETAREVLSSLAAERDVAAVTLYIQDGEELYRDGTPSAWVERARAGVVDKRVFRVGDRAAVVAPVVSLEGPRGVLVIEVSLARVLAGQADVLWTAIAIGIGALGFGVLAAWLIARSFVRRLRAIAELAGEVAAGSSEHREVAVDSTDEIGSLATVFNQMLGQLRTEQARLRVTVDTLTRADDQLARANADLEDRVACRTAELSAANTQLQVEMQHRSQIEVELRQAQKLESVGRLASGIAHEINTPIQFVSDSCAFLDTATTDLLRVIAHHRETLIGLVARGEALEAEVASARAVEADSDIDYLVDEIPRAVERATQGLGRVSAIVQSMKEFAYQDRAEPVIADLNRAIVSTLTVARNEYKYVAEVRTELGELPPVACHVGELNQAVLNIVVNAAHAIEAALRGTGRKGEIVVRTRTAGTGVAIEIEDNGTGIPPAIVDKIFDPFFTTKEIGKGTGQGLAIARGVVVDKHHGKLAVDTQIGRGTKFTLILPIDPEVPLTPTGTGIGTDTDEAARLAS
jgi:signal transduction histidine kinase